MPAPISLDLRQRIVAAVANGSSIRAAALRRRPLHRHQAPAARARDRQRRTGTLRRSSPPYSPDLNPIGQLFAKLKALLRKAAARTRDRLWSAIGRLLDTIPEAECANYLRH